MNAKEFSVRLSVINEKSAIKALISEFINTHSSESSKEELKNFINGLIDNEFTSFGNKLGYCRNYCIEENKKEENKDEENYLVKIGEILGLLAIISEVYQEINTQHEESKKIPNEVAAISQQKDVLREINNKIKEFRSEIDSAKQEIKNANDSFNDRFFSLLINTVAILGIFVTIAFAGLGMTSIFSNLDFAQTINLVPFLWIDGILLVLTIALFIWCQFL